MPKSLHHGGTHGAPGLLGSYRPGGHWAPGDASQASGASPPFGTLGSGMAPSSVATAGGASVGSALLQRQSSAAHPFTATDVDTAAGDTSGASQSNTVGVSPTAAAAGSGAGPDAQHAWPAWATRVATAVAAATSGPGHGHSHGSAQPHGHAQPTPAAYAHGHAPHAPHVHGHAPAAAAAAAPAVATEVPAAASTQASGPYGSGSYIARGFLSSQLIYQHGSAAQQAQHAAGGGGGGAAAAAAGASMTPQLTHRRSFQHARDGAGGAATVVSSLVPGGGSLASAGGSGMLSASVVSGASLAGAGAHMAGGVRGGGGGGGGSGNGGAGAGGAGGAGGAERRHRARAAAPSSSGWEGTELEKPLLEGLEAHGDLEAAPGGSGGGGGGRALLSNSFGSTPRAGGAAATGSGAAAFGTPLAAGAAAAAFEAQEPEAAPKDHRAGPVNAVVFGVINAVVSMPTLIAYAAIVFKAPAYAPYLDSLVRFFFFSSALHQLVFVALSSLPFAIGQVQDVGLIFLSAMATDIALQVTGPDSGRVALGSALCTMTLSTFIVGLLTVLVAKLKLADMVSYVPLPVVGGYLGFVGYFCIAGGTALAAGVQVDTLESWVHLLALDPLIKLLPAAATIAVLMLCVEHVSHPLALPALLTAIPLAFHGVLWAVGWDLARAQEAGWVMPPTKGEAEFWKLWELFNIQHGLSGVDLPAMAAQAPKLAGLFLVVCFGSCMDVAAIQSDMPTPLDFNRELMTVGVSNMVTGALGAGYTGSYIFSQTVFTMRQGVFNRINGLVVAAVELLVFALPFSTIQYLPSFYFGALLVWFGIEISRDWLILSYRKLSRPEYLLLWATFIAIMNAGLELGIAAGVVMATLYFAFQYAQSQVSGLRQVAARSGRTHVYDTSSALELLGRRLAVLRLSGYIFFGSSTGLGNQVLQLAARMLQERSEEQRQHEAWALSAEQAGSGSGGSGPGSHKADPDSRADSLTAPIDIDTHTHMYMSASAPTIALSVATPPPPGHGGAAQEPAAGPAQHGAEGTHAAGAAAAAAAAAALAAAAAAAGEGHGAGGLGGGAMTAAERHWRAAQAVAQAPVVLILDFGSVTGLDSTAARTFATLVTTLASQRVNVIFANLSRPAAHDAMRQLLGANGLPLRPFVAAAAAAPAGAGAGSGAAAAANGVAAAEGGAAAGGGEAAGKAAPTEAESPLLRPSAGGCWEFGSVAGAVRCCEDAYLGLATAAGLLASAAPFTATSLPQLLARHLREVFPSTPADLGGLVAALEGVITRRQLQPGELLYGPGAAVREVAIIEFGALLEEEHFEGGVRVGSREHGPGVVVGALEFFLSRPAPAPVRCSVGPCQLICIPRAAFGSLMAHHPRALAALEVLLMRSACMDLASAQEAAHHGAAE
ncbi:hypothetical protein HYH02_006485 [Chlamydomonas schloesseri]|uniref:STAS domain-containing protein n=1 Tax=Chlamydomonas schloesseri TaxID=2026947 RepID=A0A835WJW5_9CHLO|nr:hypothetical protein HYH02_006485 [Chlamydomonas schloesseri]|eukprot:KAG2448594.1 hypothetical protein HYH02_006485 [Chlamydomonas schloesseri]